jgi:hypothetical protein
VQKVFPEAAATASGQKLDHNFGPSSDDSDDNDYEPDGPDIDKKSQEEESSSDESDFTSASDEFKAPPDGKEYLGLSSDDSEDDDYDPDAPVLEEKLKQESSSSDFTSDSEDLAATINGDGLSLEDECHMPIEPRGVSNGRKSKFDGKKMQSLNSELLSMLEPDLCQDESATVSGKRNVDRLDYKKLYDVSASDLIAYETGFLLHGLGAFLSCCITHYYFKHDHIIRVNPGLLFQIGVLPASC